MNTIVTIPCKTIRAMAREMLKGKYWTCVLVVLCCHVIASLPMMIAEAFTKNEIILTMIEVASFVVEVSMSLCSTRFFLRTFRGQENGLDSFTEPLYLTWKAVAMEFISYVQIFLWSLLLIVPGIICAIKHAQNFNVMIDNPEFSPMECIERSHEIMEGNKWKFVKLTLSFIGWSFLAELPASLYMYAYGPKIDMLVFSDNMTVQQVNEILMEYREALSAFNSQLIPILLGLIPLLVLAYRSVANAAFYDLASGNLIVQSDSQNAEGFVQ